MGHPRKSRKKYNTPPHPWNADRIKEENRLSQKYGLKNKKEIWKAETMMKRYRRDARHLLGMTTEQTIKEREQLLSHLTKLGILGEQSRLEDVLDLTVEDVFRRRLQTMVHSKGLSTTANGARQFVIHGHIALDGKKIDSPSYLVKRGEENLIGFYHSSKMEKQYNARTEKKSSEESK
jgi:small subunit ribosomal protein S4